MTRRIRTLPAIHPNSGVHHWYEQQLSQQIQAAYLDLSLELSIAWNEERPKGLAQDASPTRKVQAVLDAWGKRWVEKFDKMSDRVAKSFTARNFRATDASMMAALKNAGFTVKFRPTLRSLEAYRSTVAENVGLIKSIPQQYLNDVQSAVWSSVRAGADMATLSKELHKRYSVTMERAALIARDQNAKAKAVIEGARRQQIGITQAIWQHSSAGREPRPTHVAMNGKLFDIAKGMYDPDPRVRDYVWPGTLINCRCTSRGVVPGLEDET
jgi:SPP1 gp7 family putative phage head morphogenesis protein